MKTKSLHFGKAMSAALFVLLLVVVGTKNALAQTLMATLQHNDSITGVFYGQNALVSAHDAADNGDVITLSSGTFISNGISKCVTIHGAGCVYDTLTNVSPTIISNLEIHADNVTFEGIRFGNIAISYGSSYVDFVKCNINNIYGVHNMVNKMSFQFNNCIINNFSSNKYHGTTIINSIVRFTAYYHEDIYNPNNIYNSVIVFDNQLPINNLVAYNSIIAVVSDNNVSNCAFYNCIGIETGETLLFEGQTVQNVMEVNSYEDVFETFDGTIIYDNIYQLKNEIATSFLGHDGTEVGIYGGLKPYRTRPHFMIIRNCNVAGRTTIDNKLSVEIELLDVDE